MSWKMMGTIMVCFVAVCLPVVYSTSSAEAALEKKNLALISKAAFEVVVLKPTQDSLTYERPLPLDLLPYVERTDKYRSLGTAFAVSPTEFVTAAHVLAFGMESQYKDFFIRDTNGTVYPIDKILKYSSRRDFAVFSVKGRDAEDHLAIDTAPELNNKVYAVGNALGEGIVIRDGLYTSTTPEDLKGEWKWLRFSAAASPGNSGGPLLNEGGSVIGVILRKSPNENLNMALPIVEVLNAGSGKAHIHQRLVYFLDNMPMTKIDTLDQEAALPKPYRQLNKEILTAVEQFSTKLLELLLSENRSRIFPNGKESLSLLNKHYHDSNPRMIMKGDDGTWDAYAPNTRTLELGNNGFIAFGVVKNSAVMHSTKPDTVTLDDFTNDSKIFMDTLLKGLNITRQVGPDKIKITSLGKAAYESTFTDSYERKWMVRYWNMEYNDTRLVTLSLPVPGGCITLMRGGPTSHTTGHIMDLKTLADFIYVSYCGSLKEWREFLSMKKWQPAVFSSLRIGFEYGKQLTYSSKRFSMTLDQADITITENSELHLSFGYFREGERTAWDIKEIVMSRDKNSGTGFMLTRFTNPPADLSDKDKVNWRKLTEREVPYNKVSFTEDNSTKIETVHSGHVSGENLENAAVLYRIAYRREGAWGQREMAEALESFQKKVVILEKGNK